MRYQRYFKDTNVGDVLGGHGTHVCGSAAGAAVGSSVVAPAPDYNGMAPNAKLAFDDISLDGSNLLIPNDLNTGLFPHPHAVGVRCALRLFTTFLLPWLSTGRDMHDASILFVCRCPVVTPVNVEECMLGLPEHFLSWI